MKGVVLKVIFGVGLSLMFAGSAFGRNSERMFTSAEVKRMIAENRLAMTGEISCTAECQIKDSASGETYSVGNMSSVKEAYDSGTRKVHLEGVQTGKKTIRVHKLSAIE